jgi:DNA-binding transcriptional regulator YbjK
MSAAETTPRRTAIAQAALEVLAQAGSRGLTHRAVDRQLGLAEGSTSAYFRTRAELLDAAGARLSQLDRDAPPPPALALGRTSPGESAALAATLLEHWLSPTQRTLQLARQELLLEAARRRELRPGLAPSRARLLVLAARLLRNVGCPDPAAHAPGLAALLDGLMVEQLLHPAEAIDPTAIRGHIERFLQACVPS